MTAKRFWEEDEESKIVGSGSTQVFLPESRGKLKSFLHQNSPVNNELSRNMSMNSLCSDDIDGQMRFNVVAREKHGKVEPVVSIVSFSYTDDVDLEVLNKNGRYKITAYDRRVYNAVSTLFLNGRRDFKLTELYSVMTGYSRTNPTNKQIEALEKSLTKLQNVMVYIDLTDEVNKNIINDKQLLIDAKILKDNEDEVKSAVIRDRMLHYKDLEISSTKGNHVKKISILDEPALLTYNRAKKTLITIPMEYIGLTETNATDKNIAFQDYLLMRIINYKNGNMKENKVLYDTLYKESGQERPAYSKDFIRDREAIKRMMDEWKDKGLINDWEEEKKGRSFIGIVFYTEDRPKIQS